MIYGEHHKNDCCGPWRYSVYTKKKEINLGLIGKFYLRLKSKNKTHHWIKSTYVKLKINPK